MTASGSTFTTKSYCRAKVFVIRASQACMNNSAFPAVPSFDWPTGAPSKTTVFTSPMRSPGPRPTVQFSSLNTAKPSHAKMPAPLESWDLMMSASYSHLRETDQQKSGVSVCQDTMHGFEHTVWLLMLVVLFQRCIWKCSRGLNSVKVGKVSGSLAYSSFANQVTWSKHSVPALAVWHGQLFQQAVALDPPLSLPIAPKLWWYR
mmetsp:Transcript_47068/g.134709  ORF Transcript_47068/g.134709 Transcript_47068/m.134709 type:complete len:204 (-) Transcript_47068:807-1418(-)